MELLHIYPWSDEPDQEEPRDFVGEIMNHPYTADMLAMLPDECGPLLARALGGWLAGRSEDVRENTLAMVRMTMQDEEAAPSRSGAWKILESF